jgi:hypothetical protein
MPELMLNLSQISHPESMQAREDGLDPEHVDELAEAIERGDTLPPLDVVQQGNTYWLWSGFHRLAAYQQAGVSAAEVASQPGDRQDAEWLAAGANARHGLKRTNADKQRAVELALANPKCRGMSDRAVADHVGVSHTFVSKLRQPHQASSAGNGCHSEPPPGPANADSASHDRQAAPEAPGAGTDADGDEDGGDDWLSDLKQPRPTAPTDREGHELTDELAERFGDVNDQINQCVALAKRMHATVAALTEVRGASGVGGGLVRRADELAKDLRAAKPHALCPRCKGDGCVSCRQGGFVVAAAWRKWKEANG